MTNTTLNNAVLSTLTNEKRVELAMLAGENYSQAGLFSADSKAEILECMAGCDYAMYQTVAQIWKKAYKADQNGEQTDPALMCSDNVADKAWSRMLKEFAIEVPKKRNTGGGQTIGGTSSGKRPYRGYVCRYH